MHCGYDVLVYVTARGQTHNIIESYGEPVSVFASYFRPVHLSYETNDTILVSQIVQPLFRSVLSKCVRSYLSTNCSDSSCTFRNPSSKTMLRSPIRQAECPHATCASGLPAFALLTPVDCVSVSLCCCSRHIERQSR